MNILTVKEKAKLMASQSQYLAGNIDFKQHVASIGISKKDFIKKLKK